MEIKKAIETHNQTGMAGLARLIEECPNTRNAVDIITDYIRTNYSLTPNGRCWPGDLDGKEKEIREYSAYKTQ